jgi:diguanylate cyclase (GGDEF)-like protein
MEMKEMHGRIKSFGIRNRILIFAILVAFVPTSLMGWVFHHYTKKLLQKKANLELHHLVNQAQQQAGLWCRETSLNIQIFSNSFIISENLDHFVKAKQRSDSDAAKELAIAIAALSGYLEVLQTQFNGYESLHIFDYIGNLVVKTPAFSNTKIAKTFPVKWQERLMHEHVLFKELHGDIGQNDTKMMIVAPIFSNKREPIGVLVAELSIEQLIDVIRSAPRAQSTLLSLVDMDGVTLFPKATAPDSGSALHPLSEECSIYINAHGTKVIGIYTPIEHFPWGIVIEKPCDQVFAKILELKNITLSMVALLLTIVGIVAFFVSYSILSPLKLLTTGAMEVAKGNFDVKVPVKKWDELGFTISIFNDMVERVHKHNAQLEELSTVDPLTGLFNRRHLMEVFAIHIKRYDRNQIPFSILMVDLDFFKKVNDSYGHIAGDAVLVKMGTIFNTILRSIDTAGRYGGEEFIIILDNTREGQAEQTAERIRKSVEQSEIIMDEMRIKVTVSIGIATINDINDTNDYNLINRADNALYKAKNNGRNCVMLSTS